MGEESKSLMHLKILLPYAVFMDVVEVKNIIAETANGSFGMLPGRLDCVAQLTPGILTFETDHEVYVAVDEGILVKTGQEVLISVRNAFTGPTLGDLESYIEKEFQVKSEKEKQVRSVISKLESEFIERYVRSRHGS